MHDSRLIYFTLLCLRICFDVLH